MSSGLVIHIEFGDDKHTEIVTQNRVRIGSCEDCDLRLKPFAAPAPDSLLIELARSNGHYLIRDFNRSLSITHNGSPLTPGTILHDGDEVRLDGSDIAMQFFPIGNLPAVAGPTGVASRRRQEVMVAPFIESAAVEAASTARRDDAKVFLREFTRELIREISPTTKVITLLIAVALVGSVFYWGYAAYKEQQRMRNFIAEQNAELRRMKDAVNQTQSSLNEANESTKTFIDTLSPAPKIYGAYGNGVAMILCKYELVEMGTGRLLRYPEQQQATEEGETPPADLNAPLLTPEGNGEPAQFYIFGTGFHVGGGYVLTNNHVVVEPWRADENVQALSSSVNAKFRVSRILAYFPNKRQPFTLRPLQASQRDDLAVCLTDGAGADIPVLPLDKASDAAAVGKNVVLMGYPTGYDRILANLPENESRNLQTRYGASYESLLARLAERRLIKPLTTQGHITDLDSRRIVYDARNTSGGSGAPLFGQSGRVIGINFAAFTEIQDTNYAVPIDYAVPLLQRSGWTPPETPAETGGASSTTKDKEPRPAPATTTR